MATDFVEHMASIVSVCLENNLNFEMLRKTSLVDTLTGVNNRRFLDQRLNEEINRVQRSLESLTCFFLDIDFFKSVNDKYGHQAGDQVLAAVAHAIKEQLRSNDVLVRYGGEEFIGLLSNIPERLALDIAERIRMNIKSLQVKVNDKDIQVTLSIGMATYQPGRQCAVSTNEIASCLIHFSDQALYDAKNRGRDCVVVAGVFSDDVQLVGQAL